MATTERRIVIDIPSDVQIVVCSDDVNLVLARVRSLTPGRGKMKVRLAIIPRDPPGVRRRPNQRQPV
jgi:hypothetical protein